MKKHNLLEKLPSVIQERIPGFKIRYKDESRLMKLLGKLAFFNPDFMTKYTTTWGWCVYFPSRAAVEADPERYGRILAHEYVHLLDRQRYGLWFILSYASPQIWSLGALGTVGAFYSSWFLLFLLCLLCLLPWPSPWRAHWEARGYLMGVAINGKRYGYVIVMQETIDHLRDIFEGWAYYRMCWGRKSARAVVDNEILDHFYLGKLEQHENPAFGDVFGILDA